MKRKGFLLFLLVSLVLLININSCYLKNNNMFNIQSLNSGDLILQKDPDNLSLEGNYGHIQLYLGYGFVIEAEPPQVHLDRLSGGSVYRVKTDSLTRSFAVGWAISKLGYPYDYNYTYKQINGNSYYCSELCWSSYFIKGINIDKDPLWESKFGFGVTVMEIVEDEKTYFVGII